MIFIILSGFILLTGILISLFFKPAVISVLRNNLNNYLVTEVKVDAIRFSVLKKIPHATIELKNVLVKSTLNFDRSDFTEPDSDTLLTASSIFLEFDLVSLFKKNYKLKKIVIRNGDLLLLHDRQGRTNYNIWQETEKPAGPFQVDLQNVTLSDINFRYIDAGKEINLAAKLDKSSLKGNFSGLAFHLSLSADGKLYHFIQEKRMLFSYKTLRTKLELNYSKNKYTIEKGELIYAGLPLSVAGSMMAGKNAAIDLKLSGNNLNIKHIIVEAPERFKKRISNFSVNGLLSAEFLIRGQFTDHAIPGIESRFEISRADFSNKKTKTKISDITIEGKYSNGSGHSLISSTIDVTDFHAHFDWGRIQGSYKVKNFIHPAVMIDLNGEIMLNELVRFFSNDTIEDAGGKAEFDIQISGSVNDFRKVTKQEFLNLNKSGNIKLDNAFIQIKSYPVAFENIRGELHLGNKISFDNFSFSLGKSDFTLNGYARDLLDHILLKNKPVYIAGDIRSRFIDMNSLIPVFPSKSEQKKGVHFPENIKLNTQLFASSFVFGRFNAGNLNCLTRYTRSNLSIQQLYFETMNGSFNGIAELEETSGNELKVQASGKIENADIQNLFYSFKNFNQDFIEDKHIRGNLSGQISFHGEWDQDIKIKPGSILANCELTINDGELIHFQPFTSLSKFIELEELQQVKFNTLKNTISIKNKTVNIPYMDISSSAMNLSGSGQHNFDKTYTYRIRISLSEFLSRKAKRKNRENPEFSFVEESFDKGKLNIYLLINGNENTSDVSYDRKRAFSGMKENLEEEKKELGNILKEEFSINNRKEREKQDTTGIPADFILEWDEGEMKKDSTFDAAKDSNKSEDDFIFEWDD